jgi:AGZA family xanthine/uracil permease-like MFS transporter
VVFFSGLLFIFITLIGSREAVVRAIPPCVKNGDFRRNRFVLALIGLKNASIVVANGSTFVGLVDFSLWNSKGDAPAWNRGRCSVCC